MDLYTRERLEREATLSLAKGSKLYRIYGSAWHLVTEVEIEKVTATQFVLSDGSRLKRDNLRRIGAGPYERNHYHPVCPAIQEAVDRERKRVGLIEARHNLEKELSSALRYFNEDELNAAKAVLAAYKARCEAETAAYEASKATEAGDATRPADAD